MDPLTHYMAGYFVGRRAGADAAGIRAVTLSAVAADADFIMILGGLEVMGRWHRSVTHSLLGALLIGLLVAAGYSHWKGRRSAVRILPWCILGAASHVLLDMFTYFRSVLTVLGVTGSAATPEYLGGVMLFWPLSSARYNLVDLGVLGPGANGAAMLALFCLSVAYIFWRAGRGDYVWRVWTDLFVRKVDDGKGS